MLNNRVDELLTVFLNEVDHVFRHVLKLVLGRITGVIPDPGFAGQQIDNTDEIVFRADRQRHYNRLGSQYVFDLLNHAVEVCAHTVELVDEDDASNFRFVRIAPVGF